jgi:hypothetical protein
MNKTTKAGEIIHSDVVGPFPDSYSGARYFVTFIHEWSRFIVANPICTKGEVLKCFKTFEAHFEKQYEASIKSIHSDNGGEYTPVQQYAEQKGIRVTRAAPYTPQSNGIAERTNRTLVEATRTTLKQSGITKEFWAESLANAVTVQNCIPKRNGVSPYEMLNKKCPTYDRFRPFGCYASVHLHESKRKKLESNSVECILTRPLEHGSYRLYDCSNNSIVISRHVKISENIFPKKPQSDTNTAEAGIESEHDTKDPSESTSDGQSDLSVPNLLDTETESDYDTGGEHDAGSTTESDSSAEEKQPG